MDVLVAIDDSVDDAVGLDEEIDVDRRVDVSQEVLVDGHKQFNISVVVDRGPDGAELPIDLVEVSLANQELLDQKVGERLVLLLIHV